MYPKLIPKIISRADKTYYAHVISLVIAASGILGILDTLLHFEEHSAIDSLMFMPETSWMSGHAIIISLAMLYISRALWQQSVNAWRVTVLLTLAQIFRHGILGHSVFQAAVFTIVLGLLIYAQDAFTVKHNIHRFRTRLVNMSRIVAITTLVITIISIGYYYMADHRFDRRAFGPSRVVARVLLIETEPEIHDSRRARLFANILTTTSVFMYAWVFLGLFLPSLIPFVVTDEDQKKAKLLLKKYGTSTEDYFKLWPEDKQYWFADGYDACVAYKQQGQYILALANPITSTKNYSRAIADFKKFAHSYGAKLAWIMVENSYAKFYRQADLTIVPIGSSAVIGIDKFANETVKNKWWRWKRNRAQKQGLRYQAIQPPHDLKTMLKLQNISDQWLNNGHHVERGFALGYYDSEELADQVIHTLKDSTGKIVAFANELPSISSGSRLTIDLMRFLPSANEAMPFLLSEVILSLDRNKCKSFDLGFVPLAAMPDTGLSRHVFAAIKRALKPVFSSKGLEQFKNKFEPEWHTNYIAIDGDIADTIGALNSLNAAMKR